MRVVPNCAHAQYGADINALHTYVVELLSTSQIMMLLLLALFLVQQRTGSARMWFAFILLIFARYSPQAIQFYRTSGKYLRPKKYKGDPSELVLLSWKRGVERYFQTHGVTKENEKVGIGVEMLEGDAEAWWETV